MDFSSSLLIDLSSSSLLTNFPLEGKIKRSFEFFVSQLNLSLICVPSGAKSAEKKEKIGKKENLEENDYKMGG